MSPPVFLDTNVPIYAAGRPHPLKAPSARVLAFAAEHPAAFFTNAEVLQELLHRYRALEIWTDGRGVFREFSALMEGRIEPIGAEDVAHAAELADAYADLAARDLLHLAVMQRLETALVVSADRGFDAVAGIERLDPAHVDAWTATLAQRSRAREGTSSSSVGPFPIALKHHDSKRGAAMMYSEMRTTVTLDPDVAEQLKAFARRRNLSFKAALNATVRAGLAAERGGARRYRVPARPMGLRADADLTRALRIAEALEDEEIVRKLELRK